MFNFYVKYVLIIMSFKFWAKCEVFCEISIYNDGLQIRKKEIRKQFTNLFPLGKAIKVCVGENALVLSSFSPFHCQNFCVILTLQWSLTVQLCLVKVHFKLHMNDENRSSNHYLVYLKPHSSS